MDQFDPIREKLGVELFFDASELRAGDVWNDRIVSALARCEIFLLFVSAASMRSVYCMQQELLCALDREARGLCRIVQLVLEPCDWQNKLLPNGSGLTLKRFQAVLGGAEITLATGPARAGRWLDAVREIKPFLGGSMEAGTPASGNPPALAATPPPAAAARPVPRLLAYLCDQVIPEFKVTETLIEWRDEPKALTVLLRADADDCPDKFADRITERHLRRLLAKLTPGQTLECHHGLRWPKIELGLKGAAFESYFLREIAQCVLNNPYADAAEIVLAIRGAASHRLFIVELLPAPAAALRVAVYAFAATLGKLAADTGPLRLAAMLWSGDAAIKSFKPDPKWLADSNASVRIGAPPALMRFGIDDVRQWAQLDDVRQFAALERADLDTAFAGIGSEMSMAQFVRGVMPLLQRAA